MIKIVLLLLLPFFLYASKILNYNVYDRTDRADIMITFDTPYNGIIKQSTAKSKIVLTLDNVNIEAPKSKTVSSPYLRSIAIVPLHNATQIIATIPNNHIKLLASKTTDGYGLRLRFTAQASQKQATKTTTSEPSLSMLPTKKDENISQSYVIVITIMVIGVFILLYLKRKVQHYPNKSHKESKQERWLFNSTSTKAQTTTQTPQKDKAQNSVEIRFQKAIDNENSVVMLDFGTQSYLVLMGKSNILLDKFTDEKPSSQQEFESILQSRHEELESFLSDTQNQPLTKKTTEPLQSYKERAATLLYSENE